MGVYLHPNYVGWIWLAVFVSIVTSNPLLNKGCGGVLTGDFGTLSSPNYPDDYDNSLMCNWTITVEFGHSITLTITYIDIEEVAGCIFDALEVYSGTDANGQLLALICYEHESYPDPLQINTTGRNMFILFRTDGAVTFRGFNASYQSIDEENTPPVDREPPEIRNCPDDIIIPIMPLSTHIQQDWIPPTITDNVGRVDVTFSCLATPCYQNGSGSFEIGDTIVTYRAHDPSGNEAVCNFNVTVTVVSLVCPANKLALAAPGTTGTSVNWPEPVLTGWNGPTNFTASSNTGDVFQIGTKEITYKQRFERFNLDLECSFNVTVVVVSLVCPASKSASADPGTTAKSVNWPEPVLIGWNGLTNFTASSNPGDVFQIGTKEITYKQQFERFDLDLECSFNVTVVDGQPPKIQNCPDDVIIPIVPSSSRIQHDWTPPTITDNTGQVDVTFSCLGTPCYQNGSGSFENGNTTVAYRAQDPSGNEAVCDFTVTVMVVSLVCPASKSTLADPGTKRTSVNWPEPVLTGWNGPTNFTSSSNPGDVFQIGTKKITYKQRLERFDLDLECSFNVTVVDGQPPKIQNCPDDIIIPIVPSSSRIQHDWTPPTFTDNTGQVDVTFSCLAALCYQNGSGSFEIGDTIVTYRVQDPSGNEAVCDFTVTVTVVGLVCPASISALAAPGTTRTSVNWPEPFLTGWIGPKNFTASSNPGDVFQIGTKEITYKQRFERFDLDLECSFNVTVVDVDGESPKIQNCPDDVIIPVVPSSSRIQHDWIPPKITDNTGQVDVTFSCSATPCYQNGSASFEIGDTTVTYRAQDPSGNQAVCDFIITVTVVGLVCPASKSTLADPGTKRTSVNWPEPVLTGWNGPTNFTSSSNPGDVFQIGTKKITYKQRLERFDLDLDLECSFNVTVVDGQPPKIQNCPDDVIIPIVPSSSRIQHDWTPPTFTDNTGQVDVTFSCLAALCYQNGSGSFEIGDTIVTYRVQDPSGNEAVCDFTVTVTVVGLVCPASISALADTGTTRTSVNWPEPVLTGWNGLTNFTASSNPGDVFQIGTKEITYKQRFERFDLDLECSFNVTVVDVDGESPKIQNCPDDVIIPVVPSSSRIQHDWIPPKITDNTGQVDVTFSCSATPCYQNGSASFEIGDTTVTYRAQDPSGNQAVCDFTITVTVVGLVCPASKSTLADPGTTRTGVNWPEPVLTGWNGPTNFTSSSNPGDVFQIGTKKITYKQRLERFDLDLECSFNVTVVDGQPPKIQNCPDDVIIPIVPSSSRIQHDWTPPTFTDNTGQVDVTFSCLAALCYQNGSGSFEIGDTIVTYRVQDPSGNEAVCDFTVTVTVVGLVCPASISALAAPGTTRTSVNWPEPFLTGWIGPKNFTASSNPGDVFQIGTNETNYNQRFERFDLDLECSFNVTVVGQCEEETVGGLTWLATQAGSLSESFERCSLTTLKAGRPLAVRNCSVEEPPVFFKWEDPQLLTCGEENTDVTLEEVKEVEVTEGNAVEVAKFLVNQTSKPSDEIQNVEVVSDILKNIVKAGSGEPEVTVLVIETVNNVISKAEATPDSSPDASSSSAIVQAVEKQVSLTLQQKGKVSIRQDTVHVEAVSLKPEDAENGFSFVSLRQSNQGPRDTLADSEIKTFSNEDKIPTNTPILASARLPGSIARAIGSGVGNESIKVSFLIYADDTLFQSATLKNQTKSVSTRKVAGPVVSLSVEGLELVNLTEPVVLDFQIPVNATEEEINSTTCVFWDFSLGGGVGDWSTKGCVFAGLTEKGISCHCGHTTNFAILVDVTGQKPRNTPAERALDIISQIGGALSIVALTVTLSVYLSIRKLRTGKSRQIFIHFCFSLLMLYIVFLAGIDNAKGSGGGCVFVAALLHYLTLTSMMWMAVEARNMYVSTVKVFPEDDTWYMVKACLIAWGLPLLVVVITLAAAVDHYNNEHYCFLEPNLALYLALLAPIGLILIHNIITFILVMRSLVKVKEASRSEQITKRLQNAVGISALMGITWVFGFLAINEATFAFQLIFCLANSLQGVIVFIMFCARREEVRTAVAPYLRRLCCGFTCDVTSLLSRQQSYDMGQASRSVVTSQSTVRTTNIDTSMSVTQ